MAITRATTLVVVTATLTLPGVRSAMRSLVGNFSFPAVQFELATPQRLVTVSSIDTELAL